MYQFLITSQYIKKDGGLNEITDNQGNLTG